MDVVRITSLQIVLHSGAANTVLPYIRVSARRKTTESLALEV